MRFVAGVLVVLVMGCSGGEDPVPVVSASPSEPVVVSSSPEPTSVPSSASEEEPDPVADDEDSAGGYPSEAELARLGSEATCHLLGEEWCVDSNGDGWPDVLVEAAGEDPSAPPCGLDGCGIDVVDFVAEASTNTLFLLDASGSMAGSAGGSGDKMTAAREALVRYVLGTPDSVDLGLTVYGHRGDNTDAGRPESCAGVEAFAGVGELSAETVEGTVGQFAATGWTPIAGALEAAGPQLVAAAEADVAAGVEEPRSRVIVISDGVETCGGDPVAAARELTELGIEVVVDVIGFDIDSSDRAALEEVAVVGGGTYYDAASNAALSEVLSQYQQQWVDAVAASNCATSAVEQASRCRTRLANIVGQEAVRREGVFARMSEEDPDRGRFARVWYRQLASEQAEGRRSAEEEGMEFLRRVLAEAQDAQQRLSEARQDRQKVSAHIRCEVIDRWGQPIDDTPQGWT